MNIYCVDDNPLQLQRARFLAEAACEKKNITGFNIFECKNGAELLDSVKENPPKMILLDIHMPVLDGLSTLVKLRAANVNAVIVMVSSENAENVKRFSTGTRSEIDDAKKNELLSKVVERVKNNEEEEGKINSVLDACGNLGLDPVQVAKDLGANGYIQKPYESEKASEGLIKYMTASMFVNK